MSEEIIIEKQKPQITKIILAVLISAIVFGLIGYVFGRKTNPTTPSAPTAETTTIGDLAVAISSKIASPVVSATASKAAEWKTYTNDTYGFSFKYPSDWTISKDTPGNSGSVVDQLTLVGTDSEEFHLWVNPSGFGMHGASDFYRTEILNGKIAINSREPSESSDIIGQVFTSPMTSSNIGYVIAYNFNLNNRATELGKFEKILATFQFTK